MDETKLKATELTEAEAKELATRYKKLNPTNRVLIVSVSGLLLASQEASKGKEMEVV